MILMIAAVTFGIGVLIGFLYLFFRHVVPLIAYIAVETVRTLKIWGKACKKGWDEA